MPAGFLIIPKTAQKIAVAIPCEHEEGVALHQGWTDRRFRAARGQRVDQKDYGDGHPECCQQYVQYLFS